MCPIINLPTSRNPSHRWRFFRAGGFDQVMLDTGADMMALGTLDQKLWVALSCPVAGIEFDKATLAFVDNDGDGHIRVPEVLEAVRFAGSVLRDPEILLKRQDRIPLSAIDDATDEGKAVLAGARLVLSNLGKPEATEITLDDVCDTARIFAQGSFNGDGVVPAGTVSDPALRAVADEIIACYPPELDRGGEPGMTAETIARFFDEAQALAGWRSAAAADPGILAFGDDTAARHEMFKGVKGKIEDYFHRCRLASYDARAAVLLSPSDDEYLKLALQDLHGDSESLARLPLAVPGPGKPLPLDGALNPAWSAHLARFAEAVAAPVLGTSAVLTDAGWGVLCVAFSKYEAWLAAWPETAVERIEPARLQEILAMDCRQALGDLVERDKAVQPEVDAIALVERMLRYTRDLHALVNNFTSFTEFYTRKGKASFQAGTLYLDGRSCELCVPVADVGKHAAIATLSSVCLVYCDCRRRGAVEKMTIAAAFTAGDSDQLLVGRNGVFYDRAGQDWDATIVRIVEHPISIRQAFLAPYKRIARMVSEQLNKVAAARQKAGEEQAAKGVMDHGAKALAAPPAGASPAASPVPFDVGKFAGIFAAIGLAIGAIGTMLASVVGGLFKLAWWQLPLVIAGVALLISGPSMFMAWLKLRQRNLGPILDANGWAVNARARINIPFGASLTAVARLPENSERSLIDPFAEKKRRWPYLMIVLALLAAAVLLAWKQGWLSAWIGK
ncbi:MAG TPA: hypothetical protein VGK27_08055 [Candidatus Deferrimicrobiaceae bacterium]|jgi:hypothetical protein